jgi:hypothetical protein
MNKIDERNPVRIDVNHFWVFKSPNSIPRTIMKKIESTTNNKEIPYAINKHQQGNVNLLFFFFIPESTDIIRFCLILYDDETFCLRDRIRRKNSTSKILGINETNSTMIPITI